MTNDSAAKRRVFTTEQGTLYLELLNDRTALVVARGRMNVVLMRHTLEFLEAQIEKKLGFIDVFMDASEMAGLDGEARALSEQWGKRFPGTMCCHVLFRSKLLDLAISLLRLAVRNSAIESYSSEQAWETRVAQHAPGFARKPLATYFSARA